MLSVIIPSVFRPSVATPNAVAPSDLQFQNETAAETEVPAAERGPVSVVSGRASPEQRLPSSDAGRFPVSGRHARTKASFTRQIFKLRFSVAFVLCVFTQHCCNFTLHCSIALLHCIIVLRCAFTEHFCIVFL
jgi:hypothetical protein